jgi:hypothetical protein
MAMARAIGFTVIARLDRTIQYAVTPVLMPKRLQILPSSSGSTGRSSIPRRSLSNGGACGYWIPAGACHRAARCADPVAGMTGGGGDDSHRCADV